MRIPSVSADPDHADDVTRAANWVRDFVTSAGGEAELQSWGHHPLVVGEFRASVRRAPTVLIYGHFDVQPPDPLDSWLSPPFEPTIDGEWLVARGVADDKGQLYVLLRAAADLARRNRLPVNIRILCDGEEEVLGRSVVNFLQEEQQRPDACVIFDGPMPARGVPVLFIGLRGIAYFHLRVRTGESDLHSGLFGSAALNAAHAIVAVLSSVVATSSGLPCPLVQGVVPPGPEELSDWRSLPPGPEVLRDHGARPADSAAGEDFYLRTLATPSLEVHGIASGSPHLMKTLIPATAEANFSIRLAPGQDLDQIRAEIEHLVRNSAPAGTEVDLELCSSAPPAFQDPDSQALKLASRALESAIGVRPLLLRLGGSAPILAELSRRGIPTIHSGFDVPGGNIHAPNERFLLKHFELATRAAEELFKALGGLEANEH